MTAETKTIATWQDLLAIDPTLAEIDRLIAFYRGRVNEQNQWQIYERMKSQVCRRVGWFASHAPDELKDPAAYEIAIVHVCDELGV